MDNDIAALHEFVDAAEKILLGLYTAIGIHTCVTPSPHRTAQWCGHTRGPVLVMPIVPLRLCYPEDPKRRAVCVTTDAMVRVAIHSPDLQLKRLLTSALKSDYSVLSDFDEHGLRELLRNPSKLDVLVLDFDSNRLTLDGQLALFDEIGDAPVPIVVMTDDLRRSTAVEFLRRGAFDCIRKPPSLIEFKVIIGRAHEQELIKAELERARQALSSQCACDQLVGSSGRFQIVYDLIRRVADLPASVLITGESGTGKELVARAIHNTGNRASEPLHRGVLRSDS